MGRRLVIPIGAVSLVAVALAACGAAARSTGSAAGRPPATLGTTVSSAGSPSAAPCGAAAAETLARTAGLIATRIYAGELSGSETRSDQRQVEGFVPLLSALAGGESTAIKAAVTSLVFSHTHVVRLRVTQGSRVVADVGGPYILAPVGGGLRFHGRTVGRYVLSVQDDLGYIKLVTRFIGAPLVMRTGSRSLPVEGLLTPGPPAIPAHGPVTYAHRSYEAFSFDASAFPAGPLRVSLLLPLGPTLAARSCAEIRTQETGRIAQRISRRFALSPSTFATYIRLTNTLSGALVYIRSGSRQLAGSSHPAPTRLPTGGAVTLGGTRFGVSSFAVGTAAGQARVYVLVR
ncbi:MAG TPA: hypothetical protein VGN08_09750 [Solirubrobacteraceae bacterium]|jgi:hypothetical protein